MANKDTRPPPQPAEDMFGRPTDVRHEKEEPEGQPTREQQGSHQRPDDENDEAFRKQCDAFHKHCEHDAQEEVAYGGVGAIPDGDGVRSDLGTNPLPESYWAAYPDKRPEGT
ncbi:hypothetical protein F0U61_51805 [Archangium violaceum]|uniref:hypothetical protein n=1 Tax=Archangium violaceum TaxID=83451 RepID=UPI002B29E823|nr:hypothetical protein F0U61_51805 [Archangium violaceum]